MSIAITTKNLLPIRRDGQIAIGGGSTSGGGGSSVDLSLYALLASPVFTGSIGFAAAKWRFVENVDHIEARFNGVTKLIFDDDGTVIVDRLRSLGSVIAYSA